MRGALEGRGIRPRVVFLEASDDVLIRRYSETRHRHPSRREQGSRPRSRRSAGSLSTSEVENDDVTDTSELSLRQLRERLFAQLATDVRPTSSRSSSSASATSTASRSRPTSSSTCGSCRTRTPLKADLRRPIGPRLMKSARSCSSNRWPFGFGTSSTSSIRDPASTSPKPKGGNRPSASAAPAAFTVRSCR